MMLAGNISQAQVSEENIIEERNEAEVEDDTKLFHFNLQLKNMHLWKGLHVTDAPMTAADINYTSETLMSHSLFSEYIITACQFIVNDCKQRVVIKCPVVYLESS